MSTGCQRSVRIGSTAYLHINCAYLTDRQKSIISYLRGPFGDLYVSAPVRFGTNHHANTGMIDFVAWESPASADASALRYLWSAWDFARRKIPGRIFLGLNNESKGWSADMHLHVDFAGWNVQEWISGFELDGATVAKNKRRYPTNRNQNAKQFAYYINESRKMYSLPASSIVTPIEEKEKYRESGTVGGALSGGAIGAALGVQSGPTTALAYGVVGAIAGGWIGQKLEFFQRKISDFF